MRSVRLSIGCVILVLMQVGCRSVYRLRCTSQPSTAGVLVGERMMGETPCTVTIPRDSKLIHHNKVELTFCLSDGREKTHTVDLHGFKPSNPLAEIVSMPVVLLGVGLALLSGGGDKDEDREKEDPLAPPDEKDKAGDRGMGLLGLGVMGVGAGLYHLLGGDGDSLAGYDVHVYFSEPTGASGNEGIKGHGGLQ